MKQDSESYYKTCRVLAGLTQEAAAELLHVSERSLSAYENGAEVPEDIVDRMSQAYNSPLLACWHMKHHNVLGKYLPDVFDPATNGDMAFQLIIARDDLDPATEIIKEMMRDLIVDEHERSALADQLEILRRVAGQIMSAVIYGEKLCREGGNAMPAEKRNVRADKRRIAYMEEVNQFFRERGTLVGCPTLSAPLALRMTAAMKAGHAGYDVPFPSWMIEQERRQLGE